MIVFVSGHLDLTKEEFQEHYVPKLQAAVDAGHSFVVGDAPGCDFMAQRWLMENAPGDHRDGLCIIYHMLERPRHSYGSGHGSRDPNLKRPLGRGNGFPLVGGFTSDEERDAAMTAASDTDIAWVRPAGSRRHSSGTAQNLARRAHSRIELERAQRRALPRYEVNEFEVYPAYNLCPVAIQHVPRQDGESIVACDPEDRKHAVPIPQWLVERMNKAWDEWRLCQNEIEQWRNKQKRDPV